MQSPGPPKRKTWHLPIVFDFHLYVVTRILLPSFDQQLLILEAALATISHDTIHAWFPSEIALPQHGTVQRLIKGPQSELAKSQFIIGPPE